MGIRALGEDERGRRVSRVRVFASGCIVAIAALWGLPGGAAFAQEAGGDAVVLEEVPEPEINYGEYANLPEASEETPPAPETTRHEQAPPGFYEEFGGDVAAEGGEAQAPEEAPRAMEDEHYILRSLIALCVVVGAILVAAYLLKRIGGRTPLFASTEMASILGRVYLSPRASLHFVRVKDRVLVVGVTQESVNFVAEFDAELFATGASTEESNDSGANIDSFLSHLRKQTASISATDSASAADPDGEMASLRDDIERLQRLLKEATRD